MINFKTVSKYRMHDPRIGRFFAVDQLTVKYPYYSPYQFGGNKVIRFIELEGLEEGNPSKWAYWKQFNPTLKHADDETLEERVLVSGENLLISLGNIVPGTANTLETLFTRGPKGLIEDFNESIDDLSLSIAEDMIAAKQVEVITKADNYLESRLNNPNIQDKMLSTAVETIASKKIGTRRKKSSNQMPTIIPKWKGSVDYSSLIDSRFVGPGKSFTTAQKEAILNLNRKMNDGYLRSDLDGTILDKPRQDI